MGTSVGTGIFNFPVQYTTTQITNGSLNALETSHVLMAIKVVDVILAPDLNWAKKYFPILKFNKEIQFFHSSLL